MKYLNNLNKEQISPSGFGDFDKLFSNSIALKEKVSSAIFELNSVSAFNSISDITKNLKLKRAQLIEIYSDMSKKLKEKLVSLNDEIFELKCENLEIEKKIDFISAQLRENSYTTNKDISIANSSEYKEFLNNYNITLKKTQEIIKRKFGLEELIENQKLLDKSYSSKMQEINFQIATLTETLTQFEIIKVKSVSCDISPQFNNYQDFQDIIIAKDQEFQEIKEEFLTNSNGFSPVHHYDKSSFFSIKQMISKSSKGTI